MANPWSYRSMRVLLKPAGNEAEIAVSDYDSRKHVVVAPPAGAPAGWTPPIDRAPEGERVLDQTPVDPPTGGPHGPVSVTPRQLARLRTRMPAPGATKEQVAAEAAERARHLAPQKGEGR